MLWFAGFDVAFAMLAWLETQQCVSRLAFGSTISNTFCIPSNTSEFNRNVKKICCFQSILTRLCHVAILDPPVLSGAFL